VIPIVEQDMVKDVGARRVFTVFGCEGDAHKERRPVLGEIAHFKVWRYGRQWLPQKAYKASVGHLSIHCCSK